MATTTYVKDGAAPYVNYQLTQADIGSYLTAIIHPKYLHSEEGRNVSLTTSRAVTAEDVTANAGKLSVDFSTLAHNAAANDTGENDFKWDTSGFRSGFWYGGFYLPAEYRAGGIFESKRFNLAAGELPWTFANGSNGDAGTVGLQTTTQGFGLVYVDDAARGDMSLTLTISPHKDAEQGFGSDYPEYLKNEVALTHTLKLSPFFSRS